MTVPSHGPTVGVGKAEPTVKDVGCMGERNQVMRRAMAEIPSDPVEFSFPIRESSRAMEE